jgi:hypothetical protein
MEAESGRIIRVCRIDTPSRSEDEGRVKSGLRGIYNHNGRYYISTWNKVVTVNARTFEIEGEISHRWMADLHGLYVDDDGIWLSSSLYDVVLLCDWEGKVRSSLWLSETPLYREKKLCDKNLDYRFKGKRFRGFNEFHANHVEIRDNKVFITGWGRGTRGRVICIEKNAFLTKEYIDAGDINVFTEGLHGPHDGVWHEGLMWVTETNGSTIAAINHQGKVVRRKKVRSSEDDAIIYDGFRDMLVRKLKTLVLRRPDKKSAYWTRGICFTGDSIYVGQSAWAGIPESRARIVRLDKSTLEISACFYLRLDHYPETRIFQLWHEGP